MLQYATSLAASKMYLCEFLLEIGIQYEEAVTLFLFNF